MEAFRKVFVDVMVMHSKDGAKQPMCITFEDGRKFEVDRVTACRRAAASKVGGTGIRYTVMVNGQQAYLYEDEERWFVEARQI